MTKYWSGLIAAGIVTTTAALGGQGRNPANTPPSDAAAPAGVQRSPTAPSAQTRTDTFRITGCLQNAPAVTATARDRAPGDDSTGGVALPSRSEAQFVLSNAIMAADGKVKSGAVGTSGAMATTYRLQGDAATLSLHLNKRVRIKGTLQSSSASATGAANAASGSTAASPTLKVERVKMLAESCFAGSVDAPATSQPLPKLQ